MKKCALCNGELIKKNILTPYAYKSSTITINQPQDYCEACHEGFLSHEDIQATKRELADLKRKQDGLLSSDEIRNRRGHTEQTS
jgi:HTH-type transcriptional regulator / antitoxin MqsA